MMKLKRHPAEPDSCAQYNEMTTLALAIGATKALSAIQEGQTAAAQASYQAAQARQQAQQERDKAALQARLKRRDGVRQLGAQRARFADRGVDPGAGSAALIADETVQMTALDALLALANGEESANRLEQEARLAKYRGQAAKSQAYLSAGTSLLTTAQNVRSINKNDKAN